MTAVRPIQVENFVLSETIGMGGSAVVFGGTDQRTGLSVAVKVIRGPWAEHLWHQAGREIRAAASLDHPGVVRVLDHGMISPRDAERSNGSLEAGAPYLVMPRALDTVERWVRAPSDWGVVREVLLQLLGALAHAHARGITHRDLKPSNVLIAGVRPVAVQLADFGIAQLVEEIDEERKVILGTPGYMAPEQIEGRTDDIGPCTDLYSLGCIGWALLCGAPPFSGTSRDVMIAHLYHPKPALSPRFPVPAGTERLFEWLVARHPRDRFHRAADALSVLRSLSGPTLDRPERGGSGEGMESEATTRLHTTASRDPRVHRSDEEPDEVSLTAGASCRGPQVTVVTPDPEAWREDAPVAGSPPLSERWISIRALPLSGRESERSLLWSEVAQTIGERRARVVLLVGPSGTGKSHIARWLTERVHELGLAEPMRAIHGGERRTSGLVAMLARAVGERGLPTANRVAHVLKLRGMNPQLAKQTALSADLLGPERALSAREEGFQALLALGLALAEPRMLLLWLDDLDLDPDSVAFVRWLVDQPYPVLVVGTATDPVPLQPLVGQTGARVVKVGPLPTSQLRRLLHSVVALEPSLADRLAVQVAGNPAHAVETLRRWVESGWLVPSPLGAGLLPGVSVTDTRPLPGVWRERIDAFLLGRSPGDALALEIAAAIGPEVAASTWLDVCALSVVTPSPDLADALSVAGLVVIRADGDLAFAHGQLRSAIQQRAAEGGRWVAHQVAAASVAANSEDWEAQGRHLLAAGRVGDAVEPLLLALERRAKRYEPAAAVAEEAARAMTVSEVPPEDPRWGRLWVVQAGERVQSRDDSGARAALDRALEASVRYGWSDEYAWALFWDASLRIYQGETGPSATLAAAAARRFAAVGERSGRCRATMLRSAALRYAGEWDLSLAAADEGLAFALEIGDDLLLARAHQVASEIRLVTGDWAAAAEHSRAALTHARRMGSAMETARASNGLGDALRAQGQLSEARRLYAEAARLYATSGIPWFRAYPLLNQALMALLDDRPSEAEPILQELLATGRDQFLGSVHLGFAILAAHDLDWERFAHHLSEAQPRLATLFDSDNARLADLAADIAARAGRSDLERQARDAADQQWSKVGGRPTGDAPM